MLDILESSKLSPQLRAAIRDTPPSKIKDSHYFCIVRIDKTQLAAALSFFSDLLKRVIEPPLTFRLTSDQIKVVLKQPWLKIIEISGPTHIVRT